MAQPPSFALLLGVQHTTGGGGLGLGIEAMTQPENGLERGVGSPAPAGSCLLTKWFWALGAASLLRAAGCGPAPPGHPGTGVEQESLAATWAARLGWWGRGPHVAGTGPLQGQDGPPRTARPPHTCSWEEGTG